MDTAKRTYSLPEHIVERLETRVRAGERSALLARLVEDWLDARDREELRKHLIEGCREMSALYRAVDREWNSAADEVWREAE